MLTKIVIAALCGLVLSAAATSASALDRCSVGQRVLKPGGKLGTVTATQGSGCTVQADGEPFTSTYAAFMLDPAPGAPAPKAAAGGKAPASRASTASNAPAGGAAATGRYQCSSGSAGNLNLVIMAGARYGNGLGSTGSYTTDATGRMAFRGGPWDGFYGKTLAGGRIGLTSEPKATFYQMTCDRRGN